MPFSSVLVESPLSSCNELDIQHHSQNGAFADEYPCSKARCIMSCPCSGQPQVCLDSCQGINVSAPVCSHRGCRIAPEYSWQGGGEQLLCFARCCFGSVVHALDTLVLMSRQ